MTLAPEQSPGSGPAAAGPPAAVRSPAPNGGSAAVGAYYSAHDVSIWRQVLGPGMHYHFGIFTHSEEAVDDATMDRALDHAVRLLYRHIPAGSSVLDVGCGWGGTLRMLRLERECDAVGITNSVSQHAWCLSQGLPSVLADAEDPDGLPGRGFDVVLMQESLSHIRDKAALLKRLRRSTGRLVLRANCNQQPAHRRAPFGGTMTLLPAQELVDLVARCGWRVRSVVDRRPRTMPTFDGWLLRLGRLPPRMIHGQLAALRSLCRYAKRLGAGWASSNPLLEIVAER